MTLKLFRHNAERFSKLAFGMGKYKGEDMAGLDITKVRDYATFMALSSSGQGEGGAAALATLQAEMGNRTWTEFCGLQ